MGKFQVGDKVIPFCGIDFEKRQMIFSKSEKSHTITGVKIISGTGSARYQLDNEKYWGERFLRRTDG